MFKTTTYDVESGRHVLIAGCDSEAEAMATMRWLWPVLYREGQPDPVMLVCDTRDCDAARAVAIGNPDLPPRWDQFDTAVFDHAEPVCHVLAGRYGVIVMASEMQIDHATRALAGISTRLVCIPPDDPLMDPFNRSFAAFGFSAAA